MQAVPNSGDIHIEGDVSGTVIYGNDNRVTTNRTESPAPAGSQRNSAEDEASVYAVKHGTMHVTVHRHEHGGLTEDEPE